MRLRQQALPAAFGNDGGCTHSAAEAQRRPKNDRIAMTITTSPTR